jgi:ferrous iron transport protein B
MLTHTERTTKSTVHTVAIAGNPNCGKSTLFNGLTRSTQSIGNWPGVTVEKKEGTCRCDGVSIHVVDLPGIYSLTAHTEDEQVARGYLLSRKADLIINILDATNLERNLYLTTQLLEMKIPFIIVLNMMDLAERKHITIDSAHMEAHLGVPVVPISAVKREDVERVKKALSRALGSTRVSNTRVAYSNEIEEIISSISPHLEPVSLKMGTDVRWTAVKVVENDHWVIDRVVREGALSRTRIREVQTGLEKLLGEPSDTLVADYRYGFTHGIVRDVERRREERRSLTERIDRVVLSGALGVPIFLIVMYVMFFVTMNVGGAFIDFFDGFFGTIFVDGFSALLNRLNAPVWAVTVLAGGVGGGIRTMAAFVPIIFMMFFMLSILEDSGYMARAAFVMDRFMRWIGLPGKAFVPLLVGFGCTVPAIMATRTLENRRDRALTVFITPFMSCGARFPVYALFAAAFFSRRANAVVFSLYLVGVVLAILTGLLLKSTLFRGEPTPFVMELPPYHSPRFRHIMHHSWIRLKLFMLRARVLIPMVILLSFLNSFGIDGSFGNENTENSLLSKVGKTITPVFSPIGISRDNWPASVALFSGIFSKEAVIGTLNALYSQMDMATEGDRPKGGSPFRESARGATEGSARGATDSGEGYEEAPFSLGPGLLDALRTVPRNLTGLGTALANPLGASTGVVQQPERDSGLFRALRARFSEGPAQAYAYLLFVLIYVPCIVAVSAIAREIGPLLAALSVLYLTLLGWIVSTLFFQLAVGRQPLWIFTSLALMGALAGALYLLGARERKTKRRRNTTYERP